MQVKTRLFIICCCLTSFTFGFEVSNILTEYRNNRMIESQSEIAEVESVIDEPVSLPHGGVSEYLNRDRTEAIENNAKKYAQRNRYYDLINSLSEEDIELICKITFLEAGGQCEEGKRAVMEVILNRVLDDRYPDTVYSVLSAPGQFTTWGARDTVSRENVDKMRIILDIVCDSRETILPNGNYFYFARNQFNWANGYIQIGDHWFGAKG